MAVDPTIPRKHQKLRLKIKGDLQKTSLLINGRVYKKRIENNSLDWPIQKGNHIFSLSKSGKKIKQTVEVIVK